MGLLNRIIGFVTSNKTDVAEIQRQLEQERAERVKESINNIPNECPDCAEETEYFTSVVGNKGYKCECSLWVALPQRVERERLDT